MIDRGKDDNGFLIPDFVLQPMPDTLIRIDFPGGNSTYVEVREDGSHVSWSYASFAEIVDGWMQVSAVAKDEEAG